METFSPQATFENFSAFQPVLRPIAETPRTKFEGTRGLLEQIIYDTTDKETEVTDVPRLIIPRAHIYGIKTIEEYQSPKRKRINRAFRSYKDNPVDLLHKSPLVTCAVPNERTNSVSLALINGHHRARYSARFGVNQLPCEVYSPEQMAEILNEDKKYIDDFYGGRPLSPEQLIAYLDHWTGDSIHSFSKELPDYALPRPISDAQTVEDLVGRFPTF